MTPIKDYRIKREFPNALSVEIHLLLWVENDLEKHGVVVGGNNGHC
jgi:hypothetical protein